jgi:hypothetical protein
MTAKSQMNHVTHHPFHSREVEFLPESRALSCCGAPFQIQIVMYRTWIVSISRVFTDRFRKHPLDLEFVSDFNDREIRKDGNRKGFTEICRKSGEPFFQQLTCFPGMLALTLVRGGPYDKHDLVPVS